MAEIDPTQVPHLPVPFMNADHALEARMLNELEAALSAHRRGQGTLDAVLEKLSVFAVHTRGHFLREETLMRETRFPAYPVHKAEHDRVLAEMDAEARVFRERGDGERLARYLFETLPAWFVNHTRSMDLVTARSTGSGPTPR
ncbi:MAG TPA: hemerythrin family protein [Anaeromyxobacter sp.]